MSGFTLWLAENTGLVLCGGLLLFALLLLASARSLWRCWRTDRPLRRLGRGLLVAVGLVGFVAFAVVGVELGPTMLAQARLINRPAPALDYRQVADDTPGRLEDQRGKVVLVNFWATWCQPCRAEMPDLERLQAELGPRGLVVLHVSDEAREVLRADSDSQRNAEHQLYVQPFLWPEWGRPTSYLIDRQGRLRQIIQGPRTLGQFRDLVAPWL